MTPTDEAANDRRPPKDRIADELRDAIERGLIAPGEDLPSERSLADKHGTARGTAHEAVKQLAIEGLVVIEHGKRSYVRSRGPVIRLGNDRYSPRHRDAELPPFAAECARQGKTARVDMMSVGRVQPPEDVAGRLGLDPRRKSVICRESVSYADDDAVHRVTTWIPWEIAKGTGLTKAKPGHPLGIYGVLEDQGHTMTRMREEVSARMPTPDEAEALGVPLGVAVLDVLHTSLDQNGQAYELTRFVMRADLTGLLYDTPVE